VTIIGLGSFPFQVITVFLVFIAEHFEDVVIGHERVRNFNSKGLRIHFGIIKGDLIIQVPEIAAMETLYNVQGFAVWMTHSIQHRLVVKPGRFDNERVLFPVTCRVAQVCRQGELVRKLAASVKICRCKFSTS